MASIIAIEREDLSYLQLWSDVVAQLRPFLSLAVSTPSQSPASSTIRSIENSFTGMRVGMGVGASVRCVRMHLPFAVGIVVFIAVGILVFFAVGILVWFAVGIRIWHNGSFENWRRDLSKVWIDVGIYYEMSVVDQVDTHQLQVQSNL